MNRRNPFKSGKVKVYVRLNYQPLIFEGSLSMNNRVNFKGVRSETIKMQRYNFDNAHAQFVEMSSLVHRQLPTKNY
jgi:hypothetical protein